MATTGSSSSLAVEGGSAVDLVVGVTAGAGVDEATAAALGAALAASESPLRLRLVVADGGSTPPAAGPSEPAAAPALTTSRLPVAAPPGDRLVIPFQGQPGRARLLQAMLAQCRSTDSACVVLDGRAPLQAASLVRMIEPLRRGACQFVVAAHARHPLTGALVHGLIAPTFRALYGARIRWPIGPDFACSPDFVAAALPHGIWESSSGQAGIDLWLCTTAVCGGFRVGEAIGDEPPPRDGAPVDLSTTVAQLVGQLFCDMEERAAAWQRVRGSAAVPRFGAPGPPPAAPHIDPSALADAFRQAHAELTDLWAEILPPLATLQWRRLAAGTVGAFRVDDALWARTVYDFAMGHRLRVIARDHVLRSLTPLYRGWLASFGSELQGMSPEQAEERLERLCLAFEAEKPYLISQWRWPERFRPVRRRR
jgi:hypothetical protein